MFTKANIKHLTHVHKSLNIYLIPTSCFSDESSILSQPKKVEELRDQLDNGPQFSDFIAGVVPRETKSFNEYTGKIKRERGEAQRY